MRRPDRGGVEELIKRSTSNGVPKKPSHLKFPDRQKETNEHCMWSKREMWRGKSERGP